MKELFILRSVRVQHIFVCEAVGCIITDDSIPSASDKGFVLDDKSYNLIADLLCLDSQTIPLVGRQEELV